MNINTIYGEMEESLLTKKDINEEDDNAFYEAVEYYLGDELVHRSAHVTLKSGFNLDILTERIG